MNECEKIQIMLMEAPDAPEVVAHLAKCPECSAFADFERRIMAVTPNAPDSPDFSSVMAALRRHGGNRRRSRRPLILWLGGAAAALFALSAVTINLELPDSGTRVLPESRRGNSPAVAVQTAGAQSPDVTTLDFSWDDNGVYSLETDFEAMTVACNWNIPEYDSTESEVLQ